jgi:flavodoxin
MKKSVLFSACLSFVFAGGMSINAETTESQEETGGEETSSESEKKEIVKVFAGRGGAEDKRKMQLRDYRYSYLEPAGVYARSGDILTVNIKEQEGIKLAIGSPKRNVESSYVLKQGDNVIQVENEGPVYIINTTNEAVTADIKGATGQMPYFSLGETSVEDFKTQMTQNTAAKDVQLVSQKAIVTVSYEMAKKYLGNPQELMEYFDRFLLAQDKVSGITDAGKPVNHTDRHFQHFVEVDIKYMYASQEYMGFHGDAALQRLLKTNNGWGIWHESGHQRQQNPWKWSSVTESTVNIYSMAAQKELYGKVTALDKYYPQMYEYLAKEDSEKVFNNLNNDVKMVFFGQLEMIFGDKFYPRLHQYYRENAISLSSDEQKIQQFILNVSKITGYDLTEYFEQWGFTISDEVRAEIANFLPVTAEIWQTGSKTVEQLPMQIISSVQLSPQAVEVTFLDGDTDLLAGEKIVLTKNGEVIAELNDKQPSGSTLNGNVWRTEVSAADEENIQVAVQKENGLHPLYENSLSLTLLAEKMTNLLASDSLGTATNQVELDHFREVINTVTDKKIKNDLSNQLETLQQAYLNTLFDKMTIEAADELTVYFKDDRFTSYENIVIKGDGTPIAEIQNGTASNSVLNENVLKTAAQGIEKNFSIEVDHAGKTYEIASVKKPLLDITYQLNSFQNQTAAEELNQEKINQLRTAINQLDEPNDVKTKLSQQLQAIQQSYLEGMVGDLYVKGNKLCVPFVEDIYKNYKIVILKDAKYLAEVTNGKPYYGNLSNHVFSPSSSIVAGSEYVVEVRLPDKNYHIAQQKF